MKHLSLLLVVLLVVSMFGVMPTGETRAFVVDNLDNLLRFKVIFEDSFDTFLYQYDETHIEDFGDIWYSMAKFFSAKDSYIELAKNHYENAILLIENAIDYYHDGNLSRSSTLFNNAKKCHSLAENIRSNIAGMTIETLVFWEEITKKTYEYSKKTLKFTAKLSGNPLLQKGVTILCVGTDLLVARGDKEEQAKIVTEAILGEIFGFIIDGIADTIYAETTGLSYKVLKKIALEPDVIQNIAEAIFEKKMISEQIKAVAAYLGINYGKDLIVDDIVSVIMKLFDLLDEEYDGQKKEDTLKDIASRNQNYGIVTDPANTSTGVSSLINTIIVENTYDSLESSYNYVYIEDKNGERYSLQNNSNNAYELSSNLKEGEQYQIFINDKPVSMFETRYDDIQINDEVVVANTGSHGLNFRSSPQYTANKSNVIKTLKEGTKGKVIGGPHINSGYIFWKVRINISEEGWLATAMWLQPIEGNGISLGTKVRVENTSGIGLNLRVAPSTNSQKIGGFIENTELIIKDGPAYNDGYFWWHVLNPKTREDGWCATGDWLVPINNNQENPGNCSFLVNLQPKDKTAYITDDEVSFNITTRNNGNQNTSIQLRVDVVPYAPFSLPNSTITAGDSTTLKFKPNQIGKPGKYNFQVIATGCNGDFKETIHGSITIQPKEYVPVQSLQQYNSNNQIIPWGGKPLQNNVVNFSAIVDPNYKEFFVEVYDVDSPQYVVGKDTAMIYGNQTVTISDMTFNNTGCYKWRACVEDSAGNKSNWIEAGGNAEKDFCIGGDDNHTCSFSLGIEHPKEQTVERGETATFGIYVEETGQTSSSPINLSVSGLPTGTTYYFDNPSLGMDGRTKLHINTSNMPSGKHNFTVLGIGCNGKYTTQDYGSVVIGGSGSKCSFSIDLVQAFNENENRIRIFDIKSENTGSVSTSISLRIEGLANNCYTIDNSIIQAGETTQLRIDTLCLGKGKHKFQVIGTGCDGNEIYIDNSEIEGCGDPCDPIYCIIICPQNNIRICEGDTQQFVATLTDCNGNNIPNIGVSWIVEPSWLGNIDQNGLFTAGTNAGGSSGFVIATAKGESQRVDILVIPIEECDKPCVPYRLEITPQNPTINVGESIDFSVVAYDINGRICNCDPIKWSINTSEHYAIIDKFNGSFFGARKGVVTITAICNGVIATTTVTITEGCHDPCRIDIQPECEQVKIGETVQYTAQVFDYVNGLCGEECECPNLEWSVENTSVGTIDKNSGLFTGISVGTTNIFVACNEIKGETCVQVVSAEDTGDDDKCKITVPQEVKFGFQTRCTKSDEDNYEKRYVTEEIIIESNREDSYIIESDSQWLRTNPLGFDGEKASITLLVFPQYIPKTNTTQYRSQFTGTLTIKSKSGACEPKLVRVSVTTETYYRFTIQVDNIIATVNDEPISLSVNETPRLKRLRNEDLTFLPLRFFSEKLCYNVEWNSSQRYAKVKGYGVWRKYYVDDTEIETGAVYNPITQKPNFDDYSYDQHQWLEIPKKDLTPEDEGYTMRHSIKSSKVDGYVYLQIDRTMIALRDVTKFFGGEVLWKSNQEPVICELWPGWIRGVYGNN